VSTYTAGAPPAEGRRPGRRRLGRDERLGRPFFCFCFVFCEEREGRRDILGEDEERGVAACLFFLITATVTGDTCSGSRAGNS